MRSDPLKDSDNIETGTLAFVLSSGLEDASGFLQCPEAPRSLARPSKRLALRLRVS